MQQEKKPGLSDSRMGLRSLDISPLAVLPVSGMKQIFKGLCGSPALSHPRGGQPLSLCSQTMKLQGGWRTQICCAMLGFLIFFFPFLFFPPLFSF